MTKLIFRAGAAQVDITPPLGTLINGDFISHYAHTIYDALYAKALVLDDGRTTVALVVVDICAMAKDFLDDVKKLVQEATGIPPGNVMISSTHTHAAGSVESLLLGAADLPYRKRLPEAIVRAVSTAIANKRPARVAYGAVDAPEHVVCRRFYMKEGYVARNPVTGGVDEVKTNPFGDEMMIDRRVSQMDTSAAFLAVQDLSGAWISVLANYSMHYVGDWENGTISADYFGAFARHLQVRLKANADFVCMMSNGTSGEANIWDFMDPHRYPTEPFAKSDLIGNDLAEKIARAVDLITWETEPKLSALYTEVPLQVRKPTFEEVEKAKEIVARTRYENIITVDAEALHKIYAREQVLLYQYPDEIQFPVQLLRIGDTLIGGLGGEFFAETGLRLKRGSPRYPYFTVTIANGYVGYVPPAHEIARGGYETWRCRTSHLHPDAEGAVSSQMQDFIKDLS